MTKSELAEFLRQVAGRVESGEIEAGVVVSMLAGVTRGADGFAVDYAPDEYRKVVIEFVEQVTK